MKTENKKKIDALLCQDSPDYIMRYTKLFALLRESNAQEAAAQLKYIFECNVKIKQENELLDKTISDPAWQDCRRITSQLVMRLSRMNPPEEDFYQDLMELLLSPCYQDEEERGFALLYMCENVRLPYHQLKAENEMSMEEFRDITTKNMENVLYGCQIVLNRDDSQKTEMASLLLDLLSSLETDKDRTVVLAQVLRFIDRDKKR